MTTTGHVDSISRSKVAGWPVESGDPTSPVALAVLVGGDERGRCLANLPRPGLARTSKGVATDTSGFRFEFEPPLSPFHEHCIEVVDAATGKLLPNGRRTVAAPSRSPVAALAPIVITSTGRAGTTALMAEFARQPGIVLAERYPYEIKLISYYSAAFRALVADADRIRSTDPDFMLGPANVHGIGSNPYNSPGFFDLAKPKARLEEFFDRVVPQGYATLYRDLILQYYEILRTSHAKVDARYFCEKGAIEDTARQGARLFFGDVKELVLVRDPRDLLASAIAFWKLTPAKAMEMLDTDLPQLVTMHDRPDPNVLFVRYEDLILDPVGSRRAIGGLLGLELHPPAAGPEDAAMVGHRTTSTPAASIGRWRQDLTVEQVARCNEAFKRYMAAFDYPVAEPGTGPSGAAMPPVAAPVTAHSLTIKAEGSPAIAKLQAGGTEESVDGQPMAPVLRLNFGRGGSGVGGLGAGWSRPEADHVWSNAHECQFTLPPLGEPGRYRVWLTGSTFTSSDRLPAQRLTVLAGGAELGSVALRRAAVLSFDIPQAVVETGGPVTLTLRLPDAARPRDVAGNKDDRLLGFCLRRADVFRTVGA